MSRKLKQMEKLFSYFYIAKKLKRMDTFYIFSIVNLDICIEWDICIKILIFFCWYGRIFNFLNAILGVQPIPLSK